LQYLNKILRVAAIQTFDFAYKIKAVARKIIIAKIFHAVAVVPAVEVDIAGSLTVFIERVMEIPPYTPLSRNVVFENVQTATCPS
jgi:hypothetical protein